MYSRCLSDEEEDQASRYVGAAQRRRRRALSLCCRVLLCGRGELSNVSPAVGNLDAASSSTATSSPAAALAHESCRLPHLSHFWARPRLRHLCLSCHSDDEGVVATADFASLAPPAPASGMFRKQVRGDVRQQLERESRGTRAHVCHFSRSKSEIIIKRNAHLAYSPVRQRPRPL